VSDVTEPDGAPTGAAAPSTGTGGDGSGPANSAPVTPDGAAMAREAWERTLDVIVYTPAGFVFDALDRAPAMAALGRDRIRVQLSNARLMGDYVLHKAARDLRRRVPGGPRALRSGRTGPTPAPEVGLADGDRIGGGIPDLPDPGPSPRVTLPSERATTAAAGAAIEGYDTLSASQVVRRLDGLGPDELRAVYRHEAGTRGRRTILHRVQQLLDPGPAAVAGARETNGHNHGNGSGDPGHAPADPA
jgi:hypothetical protein